METIHVDRVEGSWAVVLQGEREIQIPADWLPEGAGEGSVVHVELRSDPVAETRMKDTVEARLGRLEETDDGDDFSL